MRIRVVRSFLIAVATLFLSGAAFAQFGVSVAIAPPELPVYEQPICPGDGYIWTPGYWAWDGAYYWVPGTWVLPPQVGFLWTPGYWGWGGGGFLFNQGYWGPSVGFYGGIDYGYGYSGHGYDGGRWDRGRFSYNTAVNHLDARSIHDVYNTRVDERSDRVSYNGGNGGINERATAQEESTGRENHVSPIPAQTQHAWAARSDPQERFTANRGTPPVAATSRPNLAFHPRDLPPIDRPTAPNTGNAALDQKFQKQQDSVIAKQTQQRQNLEQKQENQHSQLARQNASSARTQQVEQQHQQQTQHLEQRNMQQMQQMQQRQQSAGGAGSHGGGHR
jgi:hypothetical protein